MGHWDWHFLCGKGNGTFVVWIDNDFGHCFEKLVFVCTSHILLGITSTYHFSRHQHRRIQGTIPHQWSLYMRLVVSILMLLAPLLAIALIYLYEELHPSLIDIISWCIQAVSWLLHSSFLWRLQRLFHIHIRGPLVVVMSYLLAAASDIIQLRTTILHLQHSTSWVSRVEEIFIIVKCGLHLLYIISLIPYSRPDLSSGLANSGNINSSEQTAEASSLLHHTEHPSTYGTVDNRVPLGVAEDNAGCLSKLTFWWVQPLMAKGAKGLLQSTTDLFILPKKLRTKLIEEKVTNIFKSAHVQSGPESLHQGLDNTDSPVDYANSDENLSIRSTPDVSIIDPSVQTVDNNCDGKQKSPCSSPEAKISLISCLNKAFGWEYYSLGVVKFLSDGLNFAGPMLLNFLVTYMEQNSEPTWHGYVYAAGLFTSTFLGSLLSTHFNYHISVVGLKIRAAIITTIYRKSLAVNSVSLSKFTTGEVINFMSTDTDRIVNFCPSFHQFWSLPVQVGVALYLLYQQVGLAFLAGLGFTLLLIPINRWIAIKIGELSTRMMDQKDGRVKVMNEILSGIRVIKFYAWEDHFSGRIHEVRKGELSSLKGRKYLDALCVYFWATTPVLISILTFMTYALLGHRLTAAKVFTSMALFNILIIPLNAFPWVINGLIEAWVSVRRVQEFLQLPELQWSTYYGRWRGSRQKNVVQIEGGHFSWSPPRDSSDLLDASLTQSYEPFRSLHHSGVGDALSLRGEHQSRTLELLNINLAIPKGSLVGVVGKVGCGKSSLLSALLAEMQHAQGHISVQGLDRGFGLAGQEPWLQHASIRDNILFGRSFVQKKYNQVLEACALLDDLKVLPGGDQTEVGERGVTLSGGQKARLALARAVYQDKDLYLLDDPLSAVDAHVAQHLFEQCITGLLRHKTRILATHHTCFLHSADLVVVMEDGRIVQCAPPSEITGLDELAPKKGKRKRKASPLSNKSEEEAGTDDEESEQEDSEEEEGDEEAGGGGIKLMEEEEKAEGVVKLSVYKAYWRAVGLCLAPTVLLSLILMQATRNISDWWLSYWVTHSHGSPGTNASLHTQLWMRTTAGIYTYPSLEQEANSSGQPWANLTEAGDNVQFYLTVYGALAGANTLFTLLRAFLFAYGGVCAATVVHRDLLKSILKAPVGFFDVTPLGRIMNRFSTDVYSVDDSLPFLMNILLAQGAGLAGTLVVCCYGLPWITLLLLPLGLAYYFIQKFYRQTSRELKRITSVSLSPIYAHFSETITGLTTIRALREMDRFEQENKEKLEENQRAQFASTAVGQWLGIRLQMIGVAMVTAVAFIGVLEHHFQVGNAGLVGLAMTYALTITGQLNGVVTMFTETEKTMVSMERADHYIHNVPSEKAWSILNAPPFWPIQGSVSFQHVELQYRPGLPNALKGVTFETQPAEKIGIVGRTGSGKSSLFLALFRMVEIQSGSICVDGLNVGHLPLQELRSKLAIIPQDPFLFSGSVRDNLDPLHSHGDHALWQALDKCHLRTPVERLGGLDADVAERGRYFSVGQRQLLCLARAMVTQARVLCIDEATASVDQATDALLQATLRQQFTQHTVLTIAHRTRTVLDCDRVLVMSEGRAIEFEPPSILLQNPNSAFYGLVHGDAGH